MLSFFSLKIQNAHTCLGSRNNLTVRASVHHAVYGQDATSLCLKWENKLKQRGL